MAPTLETSRLVLRGWRDSDVAPWIAMNADPRVMKMIGGVIDEREASEKAAQRMRASIERDGHGWWVVEVKDGAPFAGLVALKDAGDHLPFEPKFEVGWRFVAEQWGRGYATEAARAALDFAFDVLGREQVVAMTAKLNVPSRRVMERLGMVYDPGADFTHPLATLTAELKPHVLYRLHRADWFLSRAT